MKLLKNIDEWEQFEEEVAEYFEGKRQRGSGNGPIQKGDVRAEKYLIECKYTSKDFYKLSWQTWEKICSEALSLNLIPLFACRSQAGDYYLTSTLDYCGGSHFEHKGRAKNITVKEEGEYTLLGHLLPNKKHIEHSLICRKLDLD